MFQFEMLKMLLMIFSAKQTILLCVSCIQGSNRGWKQNTIQKVDNISLKNIKDKAL